MSITTTGVPTAASLPFAGRGPLSSRLLDVLVRHPADTPLDDVAEAARAALATDDVVRDEDVQLSLTLLYSLHYGSLPHLNDAWEWDPDLLRIRHTLEAAFEAALRSLVIPPVRPRATVGDVADCLFAMTAPSPGPSLSQYMAKKASPAQAREFLVQRSAYTLREADPHSWAIPRLTGRAKAALVEIQSDEYGGGRAAHVHAAIFARAMTGAGLDPTYGAYLDQIPAITLASLNTMSLFGVHRRLRGAIVGHLAAFEMTSSLPNRGYADGFRRLGYGAEVTEYFDEHVEADAVHEQIAGRDLAGALAEDEPDLLDDILFGAAACLAVDGRAADHVRDAWEAGRSSLRTTEDS